MTTHIEYTETSGQFMALLKVTESNGDVRQCYIPKILIDLIKNNIVNTNWTNLINRTANSSWDLI